LLKAWMIFTVVFVWARTALPRIRTDQILEFGWRMLLPLSVLQVALAIVYRIYLFDASALDASTSGGWSWDAGLFPWAVPVLTTAFWLAVFWVFMNDEDDTEDTERMYHVQTLTPAGTHIAGTE